MDELDRAIINRLQGGFPLCKRPFAQAAREFGVGERELLSRMKHLLAKNILTRFGPLYDAERLGGAITLCAMSVPAEDFERAAALVNAHPEVAHNYERAHRYNMWFVLGTTAQAEIGKTILEIERETGYPVLDLPRLEEYFIGLQLAA